MRAQDDLLRHCSGCGGLRHSGGPICPAHGNDHAGDLLADVRADISIPAFNQLVADLKKHCAVCVLSNNWASASRSADRGLTVWIFNDSPNSFILGILFQEIESPVNEAVGG